MDDNCCIVCGMSLSKDVLPEGAKEDIKWCMYCGTKDEIYPYDALVKNMASFIQHTQCVPDYQALEDAKSSIETSVAYKEGLIKKQSI